MSDRCKHGNPPESCQGCEIEQMAAAHRFSAPQARENDRGLPWLRTLLAAEVNRSGCSTTSINEAAMGLRNDIGTRFLPRALAAVLLAAALQEIENQ